MKNLVFCMFLFVFTQFAQAGELEEELISRTAFGRSADVEYLLEKGANPNALNVADQPAIIIAASRIDDDAPKIVSLLVAKGADFNQRDNNGDDAIFVAVKRGHPESLKVLLSYLPAMQRLDSENKTLLDWAEIRRDDEILALVQTAILDENIRLEAHRTDDNFRALIKEYSTASCNEAYIDFYLKLGDEKEHPNEFYADKTLAAEATRIKAKAQLERYFDLPNYSYKELQIKSGKSIIEQLLNYEKIFQRKVAHIGREEDIDKRCEKLGSSMARKIVRRVKRK